MTVTKNKIVSEGEYNTLVQMKDLGLKPKDVAQFTSRSRSTISKAWNSESYEDFKERGIKRHHEVVEQLTIDDVKEEVKEVAIDPLDKVVDAINRQTEAINRLVEAWESTPKKSRFF